MSEARYTHGHHESVLRSHTWRTVENSAAYLIPHLRSGMSVLDVGCGPGTITVDLARRVAPGRVLGIDTSPQVVGRAIAFAQEAGVAAEFLAGDIYRRPPAAERFDVVHAHQVLQHLPDPVGALRAMGDSCAPGGLIAARDADYAAMFWHPHVPELDEWLELYRAVAKRNGGEPDAARHLPAWARAAGFAEISVIPEIWCFSTTAERDWWGGLWADRTRNSATAEVARDAGLATTADLDRIADGWRRWAAERDAIFLVPHVAILCRNPTP